MQQVTSQNLHDFVEDGDAVFFAHAKKKKARVAQLCKNRQERHITTMETSLSTNPMTFQPAVSNHIVMHTFPPVSAKIIFLGVMCTFSSVNIP
jgi:hypothetical protein